jgi:tubulin epsilon
MPREILSIQVGQCGNQIGSRFWDLALREHANRGVLFDDAMSSFFKFEERNFGEAPIIKARAMVVDMEEGVINQLLKSDIGELFDNHQLIKDVSGAGNNWAHAFYEYGRNYTKIIVEKLQKMMEECDSPQCFMLMHSIGGGTGSGLGSFIVKTLADEYPEMYKFTVSVFPSKDDDVITSPYNSILSLNQLINCADCVLPIDNQSLIDVCERVETDTKKENSRSALGNVNNVNSNYSNNYNSGSILNSNKNVLEFGKNNAGVKQKNYVMENKNNIGKGNSINSNNTNNLNANNKNADLININNTNNNNNANTNNIQNKKKSELVDLNNSKKKPYDKMNSIIAHVLCNLTCSMRFEGSLNVDINDITMNLVPFPRMHFILSAISPMYHVLDKKLEPRRLDQIFYDVFNKDHQLISVDNLNNGVYLASALIARGNINISDINTNLVKQRKNLKMVSWNHEGFKIGLCDQPPVNMNYGLLSLSNNTAISNCFENLRDRFSLLYKRKAHVHHYYEYMKDKSDFDDAIGNVEKLIFDYNSIYNSQANSIGGVNKQMEESMKLHPVI